MSNARTVVLTSLAMLAFAANSLLCRAALGNGNIDAASFTSVRLISGAVTLWLIVRMTSPADAGNGSWWSALALLVYAACFSFAYVSLPAATGALLLFAAVQATMIGYGLWAGERLRRNQIGGIQLAAGGVVGLMLPGLSAPPVSGAMLMLVAGLAWGVYSLRGRGAGNPTRITSGNFIRAALVAGLLSLFMGERVFMNPSGFWYAAASGALASGIGYAIWYAALPSLRATTAATVQLSVPAIAALGGVILLDEAVTPRLLVASAAILGGIALAILERRSLQVASVR